MFYSIILDDSGVGISTHAYIKRPEIYPSNEIECTKDQAQNPAQYQAVDGVLVSNLLAVQDAQEKALKDKFKDSKKACNAVINGSSYDIDTSNMSYLLLSAFMAQQNPKDTYMIGLTDGSYAPIIGSDLLKAVTQIYAAINADMQTLIGALDQVKKATKVK